jgi:hypothetical protein
MLAMRTVPSSVSTLVPASVASMLPVWFKDRAQRSARASASSAIMRPSAYWPNA